MFGVCDQKLCVGVVKIPHAKGIGAESYGDEGGEKMCPRPESNQRHADFQSAALPTELPGHRIGNRRGTWLPWVEGNDKRSSLIREIKVVLS
ncbi:MAG: hypothetical protein RL326_130 [Pseudomonadota bacterium]